jgi:Tfp pilus assembly protein PilE
MSHPYNGKRKGISLVEMTIAVILFAVLSTIALLYYKSLFNIDLTAKKARVAALMDQGYQLSGAYDVYTAQFGVVPTLQNLYDFNQTNVAILTELPRVIKELSTIGWELNTSFTAVTGSPAAFQFALDLNGSDWNSTADDDKYCAIYNHEINTSLDLNVSSVNMDFGTAQQQRDRLGKTFCYSTLEPTGLYKQRILIIK